MIDGGLEFEGSAGPRAHERHARSDPAHAVEGDRPVVDLVRAFQCGDCADVALGEQRRIAKRFGKRPGAAQQHIELNPGLRQLSATLPGWTSVAESVVRTFEIPRQSNAPTTACDLAAPLAAPKWATAPIESIKSSALTGAIAMRKLRKYLREDS